MVGGFRVKFCEGLAAEEDLVAKYNNVFEGRWAGDVFKGLVALAEMKEVVIDVSFCDFNARKFDRNAFVFGKLELRQEGGLNGAGEAAIVGVVETVGDAEDVEDFQAFVFQCRLKATIGKLVFNFFLNGVAVAFEDDGGGNFARAITREAGAAGVGAESAGALLGDLFGCGMHMNKGAAVGLVFDVDVHNWGWAKKRWDRRPLGRGPVRGARRLEHFVGFDKWKHGVRVRAKERALQ